MKRRVLSVFAVALVLAAPALQAGHGGPGTHFGAGNIPDGCSDEFDDSCYHMRVGLNHLDTPIIDVLLVLPASTYAERDLRVMRQAIEMWDAGIRYLGADMGLDWLAEGVEFNIFLDDDEFTTHPAWDPEIIVVATNPVGGAGIGIDPFGISGPCKGANPLAGFEVWEALPGFDSHHTGHSGTYVESCEGGGTTCYAVNGAIDPAPDVLYVFGMFNLVAHEVGHCLTIGHVGDALDFSAQEVPYHDIMAYADEGRAKCVSTLDVEGFAVRMSRYLLDTPLQTNAGNYHTQHPVDHYYASSSGAPQDCPVPDDGLVPGEPADFWPEVFHAELDGPDEVANAATATFSVTTSHAAGPVSCTIVAAGDPVRSGESADGCSVDLGWDEDGEYLVEAVATDGVDEAEATKSVYVRTPGAPRVASERYTGPSYLTMSSDFVGCGDDTNYGGACFAVRPGETVLTVEADDDVTERVDIYVDFRASGSSNGAAGYFCARAADVPIPAGTTAVRVEVTFMAFTCLGPTGMPSEPATTGTLTAEFR